MFRVISSGFPLTGAPFLIIYTINGVTLPYHVIRKRSLNGRSHYAAAMRCILEEGALTCSNPLGVTRIHSSTQPGE